MKINRQDKKNTATFHDFEFGTVFEYAGEVYMKIPSVNGYLNAINMSDTTFAEFLGNEVIRILDAELVIK